MVDDKEVLDMIFPQDFKVGAGDKFKVRHCFLFVIIIFVIIII